MAGLLSSLAGLLGQPTPAPQPNPPQYGLLAQSGRPNPSSPSEFSDPHLPVAPPPVDVSPIAVSAAHQTPSATRLNNTQELTNATQADQSTPLAPSPSNLNYGGIPGALGARGTLGSLLGHLGDAFLIGAGRTPFHVAQAQQQQIAQASVGAETDPRAAAARVAATGVPGAQEAAQKLIDEANQNDLRKQIQQQNFQYQQSRISEQTDNTIARRTPAAQGFVQGAPDAVTYAKKYALLDNQVKGIDPNRSAADAYGIPTPDQWQPGMLSGAGMTSNQQQVSSDKGAQRQVSMRDTDVNANSRLGAASVGANSRMASVQPSQTAYLSSLIQKQNSGQSLTPAEQAYFNHYTAPPRAAGIHLGVQPQSGAASVSIANAGAGNPVANGGKPVTPQQAASLPKGTHFLTSDGRWLVR